MTRSIVAQQAPLQVNANGMFLVGAKVAQDTLVAVFHPCALAAEISTCFPLLRLADELATTAFYLNHQQEVEAYLGQQQAQQVRQLNQTKFDSLLLRDRVRSHVSHS